MHRTTARPQLKTLLFQKPGMEKNKKPSQRGIAFIKNYNSRVAATFVKSTGKIPGLQMEGQECVP
jgi:hypothetical protein